LDELSGFEKLPFIMIMLHISTYGRSMNGLKDKNGAEQDKQGRKCIFRLDLGNVFTAFGSSFNIQIQLQDRESRFLLEHSFDRDTCTTLHSHLLTKVKNIGVCMSI
jgi:hypothetical protein